MNRSIVGVARLLHRSGIPYNKQHPIIGIRRNLLQTRPTQASYKLVSTRQSSSGSGSGEQGSQQNPNDGPKYLIIYSVAIFGTGMLFNSSGGDKNKLEQARARKVPYLIVGNGTTALNAAYGVRLQDPEAKVLIASDRDTLPYKEDALFRDMWLADDVNPRTLEWHSHTHKGKRFTESIYHESEHYYLAPKDLSKSQHGGVALAKGVKIERIDPKNQLAVIDGNLIKYDKCLLVSDSTSPYMPVLNKVKDDVTYYEGVADYMKLRNIAKRGASVIVLGGTQQACELAVGIALCNLNKTQVGLITEERYLLGDTLPEALARVATKHYQEATEIDVFREDRVEKAAMDSGKVKLTLKSGEEVYCDHVVVASGSGVNTSLVEKADIKSNLKYGAPVVDSSMQAVPNLYIAGDGVAFEDPKLGTRRFVGKDQRVISGRLAGSNMAGARKTFKRQPIRQGELGVDNSYVCLGNCNSKYSTITYFPKSGTAGSKFDDVGVVFYTLGGTIQGILLWNMSGFRVNDGIDLARQILKSDLSVHDIDELVKEFRLNTWDEYFKAMKKVFEERKKQREKEEKQKQKELELKAEQDKPVVL